MAEDVRATNEPPSIDTDAIASRSFTRARRGFDTDEVRAHLLSVAEQVRTLRAHQAELERRVRAAETQAARAHPAELDTHEVARLLGEETARVLETARQAADEIRAKATDETDRLLVEAREEAEAVRAAATTYAERLRAEVEEETAAARGSAETYADELRRSTDEAAAVLRSQAEADAAEARESAQSDAARVRSDADEYAARLRDEVDEEARGQRDAAVAEATATRDEAEAAAARTRADAEEYALRVRGEAEEILGLRTGEADEEADRIRQAAEREREALLSEGATALDETREQCRQLIEEAEHARDLVLGDLAKRRRHAAAQLEQLQAARERILAAYATVRDTVDAATGELDDVLPAAKRAADEAVRRAEELPEPTAAELEEELSLGPLPAVPHLTEPAAVAAPAPAAVEQITVAEAVVVVEEVPAPVAATVATEPAPEPASSPQAAEAPKAPTPGPAKENGRGRRRRSGGRKSDAAFAELDTGELPSVEPSAEFEEVRLLAPTAPSGPAEAPADARSGEQAAPADDEVQDLFERLRASREQAGEGDLDAETAAPATESDASTEPDAERAGERSEVASGDPELLGLLEARDQALEPIEAAVGKALKRALSDEQSRILDGLRKAKRTPSLEQLAGSLDEQTARYRDVAAGHLADAWTAGVAFAARQNPAAVEEPGEPDLAGPAGELSDNLVTALRGRLERCLEEDSEAATSGDATAELELADRVRACYREWRSQRLAELVADTVATTFAAGQFAAFPKGCPLQWCVDPNGGPCPDAEDNALAGAVVKGSPFPTGHTCPPAHPGCRCLLVPAASN